MDRDERIAAEAAALWKALYGEPPPLKTDPATMLDVALQCLPEMSYQRLRPERMRRTEIVFPREADA